MPKQIKDIGMPDQLAECLDERGFEVTIAEAGR